MMIRRFLFCCLLLASLNCQACFPFSFWKSSGGAPTNNIAIVNWGGVIADNTTLIDTSTGMGANWSGSVTNGNTVIVCVAQAADGWTPASGDLTKTSGTATIGTVVLDNSKTNSASEVGFAIFRVPITGSGTIVLSCTNSGRAGNFYALGAMEFSNFNATPASTTDNNSGTGTTRSTTSMTTTNPGVIVYVASGLNTTNYSSTNSDTLVFKATDATSHMTGLIQYKLITSSPNTLSDTTGADSAAWWTEAMAYKSN